MAETALANHPPAVKVGGRRLSVSKPKHRSNGSPPADTVSQEPTTEETDYPRPAPPQSLTDNEDEQPKKEKRQGYGSHEAEKKVREGGHRKSDLDTMPTRDSVGGKGGFGGAGRVLQPSGKGFAA